MSRATMAIVTALFLAGLLARVGGAEPRVLVLGIDGMDPRVTERLMEAGELPHLASLRERGDYRRLGTSNPPQSPVAWSDFTVGAGPGIHGIADFIHRDPATMRPVFSMSKVRPAERVLDVGSYSLPLSGSTIELLRKGTPFWEAFCERDIPAMILRLPANFPPRSPCPCIVHLSGMGTPDLQGGYGTFSFFTNDPEEEARLVSGGMIRTLGEEDGWLVARLAGPENPFRHGRLPAETMVKLFPNEEETAAVLRTGTENTVLSVGEWSDWTPVEYELMGPVAEAGGMVRFFLQSLSPHVRLYVSPVNIDPMSPALPISAPGSFSAVLARETGRFYTQGMPEETAALSAGVLSDEEFLQQAAIVERESVAIFHAALKEYDEGFRFVYFSSVDQVCHMMWRQLNPADPLHNPELAKTHPDPVGDVYRSMDRVVGEALRALDRPEDVLVVMSDHGFERFHWQVELNQWLRREGYLVLRPEAAFRDATLADVDWSRTTAYNIGLNSIYFNVAGREAEGIVPPEEVPERARELMDRLLGLRNPADQSTVISRAWASAEIYRGPELPNLPDVVVGFAPPHRISWKSAVGEIPRGAVVLPNTDKWSGDHCIDPEFVPGVFFCNRPVTEGAMTLQDVGPTLLGFYGLGTPGTMQGRSFAP